MSNYIAYKQTNLVQNKLLVFHVVILIILAATYFLVGEGSSTDRKEDVSAKKVYQESAITDKLLSNIVENENIGKERMSAKN